MRYALAASFATMVWLLPAAGCAHLPFASHHADVGFAAPLPNPLPVPEMDPEYLWQQVVDTIDDYFRIAREERMRTDGGIVTDGRLYTYPETGATCLEPWRKDSANKFEKLHATFQSLRRYASVRVAPGESGYLVELAVFKELEDLDQPEQSPVGAATLRYDDSLVRNEPNAAGGPLTAGWIPLGRDAALEQRMLAELQGRLAVAVPLSRLPVASPAGPAPSAPMLPVAP